MERTAVRAVIAVFLAASGCGGGGGGGGGGTTGNVCVPGMSVSCACTNGTLGAQVCEARGEGYGACMCGGGPGAAGTTGAAGTMGTGGATGNAGTIGSAGTTGAAGSVVTGGTSGSAGTSGRAGTGGSPTGSAGVMGTAGASGSTGMTLAATWTFSSLIATGTSVLTFPTYASHLLGKQITEPFPTDFACASVVNSGSTDATVHLSVALGAYAASATTDVNVPAQSTKKVCLTPTFAKTALYALTAPDSANLTATAKDFGGNDVGGSSMVITVPPVDNIAWSANGIDGKTLKEMAAVYVEPNALDVDKLQRLAQQYSVFGGFGGGSPYARTAYTRQSTISPGMLDGERFIIEPAEAGGTFRWSIGTVACTACSDATVDVALFTSAEFDAFTAGSSNTATAVWNAQGSGSNGSKALGTADEYVLTFINPSANFVDRTITWNRSVTREDVVRDVLLSIFSALRAANVTYSNVPSTFFTSWQHIRRVTQSLETASANCIDGTLVFASVAELLGLQPVLILRTGHAYVGIRSAPGSPVIWPIETTMVGSQATPFEAYQTAFTNRQKDMASDPMYQEVDVATLRNRGVTPLVQQ